VFDGLKGVEETQLMGGEYGTLTRDFTFAADVPLLLLLPWQMVPKLGTTALVRSANPGGPFPGPTDSLTVAKEDGWLCSSPKGETSEKKPENEENRACVGLMSQSVQALIAGGIPL
jgi:hypothetical protein